MVAKEFLARAKILPVDDSNKEVFSKLILKNGLELLAIGVMLANTHQEQIANSDPQAQYLLAAMRAITQRDDLKLEDLARNYTYRPQAVFMIAAGGCVVGTALKNRLGLPYEAIKAQSYTRNTKGKLSLILPSLEAYRGKTVLLVDDLVETSGTFFDVIGEIDQADLDIKIVTAALLYKRGTLARLWSRLTRA